MPVHDALEKALLRIYPVVVEDDNEGAMLVCAVGASASAVGDKVG
jgi:hypothetical protein